MELPVIDNCDGCGACCQHMGTPPLYVVFFAENPPEWWVKMWEEAEPYFRDLPGEARRELADYYAGVVRGEVTDRTGGREPCLWYEAATRKCRWHAWRPTICRDFEVGGVDCRRWRRRRGIDPDGPPLAGLDETAL